MLVDNVREVALKHSMAEEVPVGKTEDNRGTLDDTSEVHMEFDMGNTQASVTADVGHRSGLMYFVVPLLLRVPDGIAAAVVASGSLNL